MPGMFDDLVPQQTAPSGGGGMFDDLVPKEAPVTGTGAYRAFEEGAQRGVAGAAALPNLLQGGAAAADPYVVQAGDWLVNKLGLPESMRPKREGREATINWPTYEHEREVIRKPISEGGFGGLPEYEPQNRLERALTTTGEMLPNVVGPGGFVRGAAQMIAPATATDVVREAGGGAGMQALAGMAGGYGAAKVGGALERATAVRALPSAEELKDIAQQQGYRPVEARALQETLTPLQAGTTYRTIAQELNNRNAYPYKGSAPKVFEALEPLQDADHMGHYLTARKALNRIGGEEAPAARYARDMIDTALEQRIPGSIPILRTADQNYKAFKSSQGLQEAIKETLSQTAATWSGMNVGNKMHQLAAAMAKNKKITRYLEPDEVQALHDAARGSWTQFSLRMVSNILGGGGGLGALTAAGFGHLLAPGAGTFAPIAGFGTRMLYNQLAKNQMARLNQQILAGSAEAAQRGITLPQARQGLPYGSLAGYLGYTASQ